MSTIEWKNILPGITTDEGWSHSGIAVTDAGVVIFAEPSGSGLILFRLDDQTVERRSIPLVEVHGIFYSHDENGERLWLADPGFKARRALGYETEASPSSAGSLDLASFEFTALPAPPGHWEPTSVVAVGPLAIVADGYGASLVHFYVGDELVRTVDGSESGTAFACPHGLAIDERSGHPQLIVADRGNRRLVFFELDGTFVTELLDPLFTSPSSLALRGDDVIVTELDGALLAVSATGTVRALIDTRTERGREGWPNRIEEGALERPLLEDGVLNSPHGIAVSRDGRIYLTEWLIGGRQLELTIRE